jgi:hypothetical protein
MSRTYEQRRSMMLGYAARALQDFHHNALLKVFA